MLLVDLDDWATRAHLARAIEAHERWCRAQAIPVPDGLRALGHSIRDRSGHERPQGDGLPVMPHGAPVLLTYDDAGHRLSLSGRSVRRLVAQGALPAVDAGGARRVHVADVDAYVERLRANA